jgi:LysR family transcriptional regulator, hydrogen peroxide-inducible genes activator
MNFRQLPYSLRQLQYFAAVAETKSFRRAAELCHVSQPTLSAQVAELEGALGVRLFERDRRRVFLTTVGEELLERARRVLLEAGELMAAATRGRDPLSGTLRLGVIPTIAPYLLPDLAAPLRSRFPRATLIWMEDKTQKLVAELGSGNLDGALLALEAEIGDLDHEIVGKDAFLLATSRQHALGRERGPVRLEALAGQRVLLLDDGHCFRNQALSVCEHAGAQELEFRATSLSTLSQMVLSGAGVTLLPKIAVAAENRLNQLAIRPFARPQPGRTLAMVWRRGSALEPALRPIARVMREEFVKLAGREAASSRPKAAAKR